MKEYDFLNLYLDSGYFDLILTSLNLSNYYLNILVLSFFGAISFGFLSSSTSKNREFKNYLVIIFTIPLCLSIINYYLSIFINYYGFLIFSILICLNTYRNVSKKSLKYITISTVIFLNSTLFIYNVAINMVFTQILSLYSYFGVIDYNIFTKDFFSIYKSGENLFSSEFLINAVNFSFENNVVFKRVYLFYYFLHSFVILFWLLIFLMVIKIHGVRSLKS